MHIVRFVEQVFRFANFLELESIARGSAVSAFSLSPLSNESETNLFQSYLHRQKIRPHNMIIPVRCFSCGKVSSLAHTHAQKRYLIMFCR